MPSVLKATLAVTTPLFLGGAEPLSATEPVFVRGASLRGALRAWFRAVGPSDLRNLREAEARAFGGLGESLGQASILLRLAAARPRAPASRAGGRGPGEVTFEDGRPAEFDRGKGKLSRNGFRYLGYTFGLGANRARRAMPAGTEFDVFLVDVRGDEADRRAVVSALWLLCALGGLGNRARRGFGSLSIRSWETGGGSTFRPLLDALPLLDDAPDAETLRARMLQGLGTIKGWFTGGSLEGKEHESKRDWPRLFGAEIRLGQAVGGRERWREALRDAGGALQEFRDHYRGDYAEVRAELTRERSLRRVPPRAAFGLPLVFRSSAASGLVTFNTKVRERDATHDRHASPLRLHIARIAAGVVPVWTLMGGPVPGEKVPGGADFAVVPSFQRQLEPVPEPRAILEEFLRTKVGSRPIYFRMPAPENATGGES